MNATYRYGYLTQYIYHIKKKQQNGDTNIHIYIFGSMKKIDQIGTA